MTHEQYIIDAAGNRNGVVLDMERYNELIEAEEELAAIRAFDEAKASDDEVISFDIAIAEIESKQ